MRQYWQQTAFVVEPLGFSLSDKHMRRAGLDYRDRAEIVIYPDYASFLQQIQPKRLFGFSTKGQRYYHQIAYQPGDYLLFGPETRGLPDSIRKPLLPDQLIKLPMTAGQHNRSLNLSNSVAITVYEAWRQQDFAELNDKI